MRASPSLKTITMSKRRGFIKKMIAGAVLTTFSSNGLLKLYADNSVTEGYIVDNPYDGVNWGKYQHIASTTHVHINNQEKLDKIYHDFKLRHIPISNYYPSTPYYPIEKIRENQFKVKQNFGTVYDINNTKNDRFKNGKFLDGPLDWNKIIMDSETGWYNKLSQEKKDKMPFKEGSPLFTNIPKDMIISPNAEHHSFTNSSLHSNAVGSMYSSGTFDAHSEFLTTQNGYSFGTGLPWETVFAKMIDQLLFADGGGITINHPLWSRLNFNDLCNMLDFDQRVLGIEVYNDTCETSTNTPQKGWSVELWDQVLSSGRNCYGFFVPDHTLGKGRNILLVSEFTEHACLKAYRNGTFYGAINGSGLGFTNITLRKDHLEVVLNKPGNIRFVTNRDQVKKENVTQAKFSIPKDNPKKPAITYVRVEAEDELGEKIFSQPIRFTS
jgi:hypothetical protein